MNWYWWVAIGWLGINIAFLFVWVRLKDLGARREGAVMGSAHSPDHIGV